MEIHEVTCMFLHISLFLLLGVKQSEGLLLIL